MRRFFESLRPADLSAIHSVPDGIFLVRADRAQYRWHKRLAMTAGGELTSGQQLAHTLLLRQGLGRIKPMFPARTAVHAASSVWHCRGLTLRAEHCLKTGGLVGFVSATETLHNGPFYVL